MKKSMNTDRRATPEEYLRFTGDLIRHPKVTSMAGYLQHGDFSRLSHCLRVSYLSYKICKRLRLDARSAARAGLLHDFFLYDWHKAGQSRGLHGVSHPGEALLNAERYFALNEREKDAILRHMWPLTPRPPKYPESYVITFADKYCAAAEAFTPRKKAAPEVS